MISPAQTNKWPAQVPSFKLHIHTVILLGLPSWNVEMRWHLKSSWMAIVKIIQKIGTLLTFKTDIPIWHDTTSIFLRVWSADHRLLPFTVNRWGVIILLVGAVCRCCIFSNCIQTTILHNQLETSPRQTNALLRSTFMLASPNQTIRKTCLRFCYDLVSAATNDKCQAAVCECDRVAAHCFAQATYNPENKNLDSKVHCVNWVMQLVTQPPPPPPKKIQENVRICKIFFSNFLFLTHLKIKPWYKTRLIFCKGVSLK